MSLFLSLRDRGKCICGYCLSAMFLKKRFEDLIGSKIAAVMN